MALTSDQIIDRKRLKQQVSNWRSLCLLGMFAFCGYASWDYITQGIGGVLIKNEYIAKITVNGIISDSAKRDELFTRVLEDDNAKALIVQIDSPGGTTVGGEELYLNLRKVAEKKPVVSMMRTLAASAGYMAAIGGDHVLAREGTITGSIGVIMQSVEISELAKNLGIAPVTITSGAYKDAPSMFRPISEDEEAVVSAVVMDAYRYFRNLVKTRRNFTDEQIASVADGRVFTGSQALKKGLVDALGGEAEARAWLEDTKQIGKDFEIIEIKPEREFDSLFSNMKQMLGVEDLKARILPLDGLVSIWHPSLNNAVQ